VESVDRQGIIDYNTHMLTEQQWELIDEKYGMLINKICHAISGDEATTSFDDNLQDLRIAAMEAVAGFEKQGEGKNGSFDEFWGSKGFDKYMKTVLWTKKNNKGAKVTKKSNITKDTKTIDKEDIILLEANPTPALDDKIFVHELYDMITPVQQDIIHKVTYDPTLVKPNGRINIRQLSQQIGLTYYETSKELKALGELIQNQL
jgi:hypothetical protein